jgi:hypothetical protein
MCLYGVQRNNFTFLYLSVARDERFIWNTARPLYIYIWGGGSNGCWFDKDNMRSVVMTYMYS